MNLRERIVGAIFGDAIEAKVKERLKAASATDVDKEDVGWRRLTGDSMRNLAPLTQERMCTIAFYLWENNPLAHWLIDTTAAFMVGKGLPYEAGNEDVKAVLDSFWKDPVNRLDLHVRKHARELHIFGELCLTVFTAEQTGMVRYGYIDPQSIKEVITDPQNVKVVIGVILKGKEGLKERKLKTVLPEEAETILSTGARTLRDTFTDGECFFFAINNVTNSPRGRSDLLVSADWLDAYEQFLFDYSDKWPLQNTFLWDLEVTGGNDSEIKKQVENLPKKSGSIYGHNEKVKLNPSAPDLKATDAETGARLFRNHILGAHGFPEHWYGGGGNVNRATAAEMDAPTIMTLEDKQLYFTYILETMCGYAIYQARKARYIDVSDDDAQNYSIITPEIASKDIAKHSTALEQLSRSLALAEMQGWIDKDTARKIYIQGAAYIGTKIDADTVKDAVTEAEANKGYDDYKTHPEAPGKKPPTMGKVKNNGVV